MAILQCGRFTIDLGSPRIMAIINLTPDSFSGDGHYLDYSKAMRHAESCLAEGAELLDIGGESTRPGAHPVSEDEELDRVIPLVERLAGCGVPISVDTFKPVVMGEAIRAGASMINDINGFRDPAALAAVAAAEVGLCVMHMQGVPRSMQSNPEYADAVAEVEEFLLERLAVLQNLGVEKGRVLIDPGFGFGKRLEHNAALFGAIGRFARHAPVLVGVSRKSMLGTITGRDVQDRMVASVAAAMLAAQRGARVLRVHDVAATRDALRVLDALTPRDV